MRFRELIGEAIAIEDVNTTPGDKPVVVMQGRFQPFTKGHYKVYEQAKSHGMPVVIYLVKGKKSSEDKQSNPLEAEEQIEFIKKSVGSDVEVRVIPDGFIGTWVNDLRNDGMEPKVFLTGTDRMKAYKGMINRYITKWDIDITLDEIERADEDISATRVRQAIKNDDFDTFKDMTVNLDDTDFEKLKSLMSTDVEEQMGLPSDDEEIIVKDDRGNLSKAKVYDKEELEKLKTK